MSRKDFKSVKSNIQTRLGCATAIVTALSKFFNPVLAPNLINYTTYLTYELNVIYNHFCNEYMRFEIPFQKQESGEYRREWVNFVFRKRETLALFIKYLLTNIAHEIANFIRYLAALTFLFSLTIEEAEKMFSKLKIVKTKLYTQMSQEFLNALIRIRHDSNSSDKIKGTAVDAWRNTKQRVI